MKKILLVMSVAILMALCSAPSSVKADMIQAGTAIYMLNGEAVSLNIYSSVTVTQISVRSNDTIQTDQGGYLWIGLPDGNYNTFYLQFGVTAYIPTLANTTTLTHNGNICVFYNDYDSYIESLPEEFQPVEPSQSEQRWEEFYEWFHDKFGYYPREGSLIDLIRLLAIGDWTDREEVEITFPTLTPTPSPTLTPTPIPVQTIFVPDGNGNTTIIYQYPDPTTGVITQSPYNPNITNNINIDCNCDGGSGDNTFGIDPYDPTALTSSMLWADGFGVQITDNPLTAANDSQQTLADTAAEYSDSVHVVSNSFNVLPFKWLTLVGLLGGILIIAGLIRTFLGG